MPLGRSAAQSKPALRPYRALLGCLLLIGANVKAQESQISWTVSSMAGPQPGVYNTQEEAAAAILALPSPFPPGVPIPNPHPYIDTVKEPQVGPDGKLSIVYWMGLKEPLDPDWKYHAATVAVDPPTEAEMVAGIKAAYDSENPHCPIKAKVTALDDWHIEQPEHEGQIEQKNFSVEYYAGLNNEAVPCELLADPTPTMRYRRQQCPNMFMQWSNEHQACASDLTASISTDKIQEDCGVDAAAGSERGNPCNVKTGAKIEHQTDISLGWIALTRSYHSGVSTHAGGFGHGWTHSLEQRLTISGTTMNLSGGSGYQVRYSKVGDAYLAADNSGDRIVASGSQWLLYRQGDVLVFDSKGRLTELRNEDGTGLAYAYSSASRLDTVTHSTGRSLQFLYVNNKPDSPISSITSGGMTLASYTYTSGRQVETVTFPGGGQRRYHYEDNRFPRHLTGVTHEDSQRYSTFAYDIKGRVISSQHAGGADGITLTYRAQGGSVVTDTLGQQTTYGLTVGTGALPRRLGLTVDERGTVSSTYADEGTDFRGRPTSVTNRKNIRTDQAYAEAKDPVTGALARTETTTEAVGTPQQRVSAQRFDVASNRPIFSTVGNQETRVVRNARLQPVSMTVRDTVTNEARTTAFSYCEAADVAAASSTCPLLGLLKSVNGPRTDVNDITTFEYYGSDDSTCATTPALCTYRKGDLRKTIDALGRTTEVMGYDSQGRPLSVLDPNGVVTDYEYQARGWLTATKVRGPDNNVETDDRITRVEHEPTGLVKKVTMPDGVFTRYTYDAAQRLTDVTDSAGNSVHYTLDLAGNIKQEDTKTAGGTLRHTVSRVFNVLSQLETLKDAAQNPTTYGYDDNGNPNLATDALGRQTVQSHDPLNRLSKTLRQVSITPVGGTTPVVTPVESTLTYNALDQVSSVTDPKSLTTTYDYNGFGDRTNLISPDTGITDYTYNAAGSVATKKDANDAVAHRYTYDALNRPTAAFYTATGAADVEYDYDTVNSGCTTGQTFALGQLTATRAEGTELRYCYDRFGQVVRKTQTVSGVSLSLGYTYTAAGDLSTVVYPDGTTVDYVRDAQARIKEVGVRPNGGTRTVLLNSAAYEPFGPVTGWSYGNGRTLSLAYDLDYRTKTILDTSSGGLSLGYGYNAVGDLSELKDGFLSTSLAKYDHDELGRLNVTRDGGANALERYNYDPIGNRTGLTNGAGTQFYGYSTPGTHRLTEVDGVARGYDAAGNTTSIDGAAREFVYNANDRLSQVKQNGIVKASYRYNALGERVGATSGSGATIDSYTLYDEEGTWIGDYDASGMPKQQAIWLEDLPVGLLVGSGIAQSLNYVQPDHQGTPRVVIDPARDVAIWTWDGKSEAFGNSPPNQDPDLDGTAFVFNLRFPGQRWDAASGLAYNYFRDYDPETGRYIQSDPIGLVAGLSTYGYASGNPIARTDALGLQDAGTLDAWSQSSTARGKGRPVVLPVPGPAGFPLPIPPSNVGQGLADGVQGAVRAAEQRAQQRTYVTYVLTKPSYPTDLKYFGRASGYGTPQQVMMARYARHERRLLGYANPVLDKSATGEAGRLAIRGREQQLIDHEGGIGTVRVGNLIRGVAQLNPQGRLYHEACNKAFGPLAPYTGAW